MSQFVPITGTSRTITEEKEKVQIGSNSLVTKLLRLGRNR